MPLVRLGTPRTDQGLQLIASGAAKVNDMKSAGLLLLITVALAGCGGGDSDDSAQPSMPKVEITWKDGPAPGTGSDVWVFAPEASDGDIDDLCDQFQTEGWPEEAVGEEEITIANDMNEDTSSLVCVRVDSSS